MKKTKTSFDSLVELLKTKGYKVVRNKRQNSPDPDNNNCRQATVTGKGVLCYILENYEYHDAKAPFIIGDNAKCFNKWGQCPLLFYVPTTPEQEKELLGYLKFLGSKKGFKWSNTFSYFNDPLYRKMNFGVA